MTTYHERRKRESLQRRRQSSRRKIKRAKLTIVVLTAICLVIAVIMVFVGLFSSEIMRHKWLMFGAGYAGGALVLFAVRGLLIAYEHLTRSTRGKETI